VVDAAAPLVLSALEGGVVVTDAAHTHWAHALGGGELVAGPMPAGLPEGPGRVVGAAGRLPGPVWLFYETSRQAEKSKNPLFRLGKEGFKQFADDWSPAIVPWTRHRILAASTSSGKIKIKVIEPSLPAPPDDLPSAHLGDASCEKTLRIVGLAALATGEVFAAGTCQPDAAAGAGASATRYVVIRWAPPVAAATAARDGGDADGGAPDHPGAVDVMPGVSAHLQHEVLYAHTPADVWAAASDPWAKAAPASRLFHYDGTTWGAVALPPGTLVRGICRTEDGTLWMISDQRVFRRRSEGAWDEVPLPSAGFPAEGRWETAALATADGRQVWVSARRVTASGERDVILRSGPTSAPLRWE
jgi:hypothetical protein